MNNRTTFSQHLKGLREANGLTPKEFAERLGCKLQSYYAYESGRAVPGFDNLVKIAKTCDVSLDWLCGIYPFVKNNRTAAGLQLMNQTCDATKITICRK